MARPVLHRTSVTDANGNTTTYAFDAFNRNVNVTDANSKVITYAFDANNNRIIVTDSRNSAAQITSFAYDQLNQQVTHTDAEGNQTTFAYDVLGNRISVVNPTASTAEAHVTGSVVDAELSAHDAVVTGFFGTIGLYDRPSEEQRDRAAHMLREVGLGHRIGHRFAVLSTGEQRRCLIARALVHRPELLILDEPTAGLDISGREHVLATIEAILAAQEAPGRACL